MSGGNEREFVLAIYPTSRGFAFVLFEGANTPFDWGVKEIREKKMNARTLKGIKKLVDRYEPEILVYEETGGRSKRSARILRFYRMLSLYARTRNLTVRCYTKAEVQSCFSFVGARTKYEIAQAVALQIPELEHRLPPARKLWNSEDRRQSLFDAAALGITHYARKV